MRVASHHVESLDVFRGATVAAMILVNNPGDWSFVSGPLLHAYWFGCTFADLVFPWFIFIMGVAMPYAFARRRERGGPVTDLHRRIVTRAVILIGLGLFLTVVSAWPAVFPLRLPGVLQRIALSYLFAAFIVLHLDVSGWAIVAAGLWIALATVTEITVTDMMQVRTFAEEIYTQMVAGDRQALAQAVVVSLPTVLLTSALVVSCCSIVGSIVLALALSGSRSSVKARLRAM